MTSSKKSRLPQERAIPLAWTPSLFPSSDRYTAVQYDLRSGEVVRDCGHRHVYEDMAVTCARRLYQRYPR